MMVPHPDCCSECNNTAALYEADTERSASPGNHFAEYHCVRGHRWTTGWADSMKTPELPTCVCWMCGERVRARSSVQDKDDFFWVRYECRNPGHQPRNWPVHISVSSAKAQPQLEHYSWKAGE